jgi:YbbR domain-containing protein
MFRWISRNYRTFLWALALAIAVWVAAVTSADPDETRTLSSAVPIQIVGQDPSLVINSDIPTDVEVTLRAPRSVWDIIEADPQTVRAILDLSGLSSGEHSLDLQIQINARPVQIVSVGPRTITFTLEVLTAQTLPVDLSLSGETAVGYQAGEAVLNPLKVVVAGAQTQVQKVKRARVSINLSGIRENYDQTLPVDILDEAGQKVDGVTISPKSVHVTLPVSQQGGYRDVAVKVLVTGRVASGYHLTDISVFPPVVTVFATNPELVNTLPGVVETQPLELQNAKEDISTRIALNLPEGISIVGEQTVLIEAGVSPIESSVTLAGEKVEVVNLGTGLNAEVSPATVDVIVSGPLPLLDTLTRQDVRVTVDLSGLEVGTHQITAKVEVLISDVVVESILPNTIEVVVTPVGSTTPTTTPTP